MTAVIGLGFVTCAIPYVGVALLTLGLAFTLVLPKIHSFF